MNVPNDELDALRALAVRVKQTVWKAYTNPRDNAELLQDAATLAANLETRLGMAGAAPPSAVPASRWEVPLSKMDTPANRRYADKLREAWEAGLEVDRERYGEKIGTDGCAQIIEMVLADVEQEIGGAVGKLRE